MMNTLPKNVWLLTIAQPLLMSTNSLIVFVGGIIGANLAPQEELATLPPASTIVGTAIMVIPITQLMNKYGRKKVFLLINGISVLIALLASYAIFIQSFYFFVATCFLLGLTSATVMQFRFAAIESVKIEFIAKAASTVLVGGIAAAFIGPEIGVLGKSIISEVNFVGSFILLAGLYCFSFLILLFYQNVTRTQEESEGIIRPLAEIFKQQVFWIAILSAAAGYMIMSFIMTATPVSMHMMDGHSLDETKWVIQSHIVAMFLPSLITGHLINRLGVTRVLSVGLVAYVLCIIIAFSGHHLPNYWISLVLLGVGWNFLFIGGTTLLPMAYKPQERFKVQSVNEGIVMGSQAIASLSAGWFVFTFGWETLLLATIPIIIGLGIFIWNWQADRKQMS